MATHLWYWSGVCKSRSLAWKHLKVHKKCYMNCGGRLESPQTAKGHCLTVCEQIMILNPTKALLSLSFPPSLYCKKSLSVWLRGQKFNISPSLGPFLCLTSFTTVRETFFPLLTTTSLLLSLRHSKLLSSLFRQPLCLLICSLRFSSKKGLTKMPFKFFFFLVRTLMERRLAPFLPGRLSWCPAVKCCGRTTKTTTQWNAL